MKPSLSLPLSHKILVVVSLITFFCFLFLCFVFCFVFVFLFCFVFCFVFLFFFVFCFLFFVLFCFASFFFFFHLNEKGGLQCELIDFTSRTICTIGVLLGLLLKRLYLSLIFHAQKVISLSHFFLHFLWIYLNFFFLASLLLIDEFCII